MCKISDKITDCTSYTAYTTDPDTLQIDTSTIPSICYFQLFVTKDNRTSKSYILVQTSDSAQMLSIKIKEISISGALKDTSKNFTYEAIVDTINYNNIAYSWTLLDADRATIA